MKLCGLVCYVRFCVCGCQAELRTTTVETVKYVERFLVSRTAEMSGLCSRSANGHIHIAFSLV